MTTGNMIIVVKNFVQRLTDLLTFFMYMSVNYVRKYTSI